MEDDDVMRTIMGALEVGFEGSPLQEEEGATMYDPREELPYERTIELGGREFRVSVELIG